MSDSTWSSKASERSSSLASVAIAKKQRTLLWLFLEKMLNLALIRMPKGLICSAEAGPETAVLSKTMPGG